MVAPRPPRIDVRTCYISHWAMADINSLPMHSSQHPIHVFKCAWEGVFSWKEKQLLELCKTSFTKNTG